MARPAPSELDDATIPVPGSVRFPVELTPPDGFDPDDEGTWPRVEGRLEWVAGRLLYMPPCGDRQQLTVFDLVTALARWLHDRPEFTGGTSEAGLRLGDDTRGADGALWRAADLGGLTGGRPGAGCRRSAPPGLARGLTLRPPAPPGTACTCAAGSR